MIEEHKGVSVLTKWLLGVVGSLILVVLTIAWNDRVKLGERVEQLVRANDETRQRLSAFQEYPHSAGAFEAKILTVIRQEMQTKNSELQSLQRDVSDIKNKIATFEPAITKIGDHDKRLNLLERAVDRINSTLENETRRGDQRHDLVMSRMSDALAALKTINDVLIESQKKEIRTEQRLLDIEVRVDDAMKAIETPQPRRR